MGDSLHALMEDVLAIIVRLDVEGDDIGHHIGEHEETGRLLDLLFPNVDDVEDGSQDLIHALHVVDEGV
jgi:hypothetical protein